MRASRSAEVVTNSAYAPAVVNPTTRSPTAKSGDAVADRLDHARDLIAEHRRKGGGEHRLQRAAADLPVERVHGRDHHAYEHLPGSGDRIGKLGRLEGLGSAVGADDLCMHRFLLLFMLPTT